MDSGQPHHTLWSGIGAILISPAIGYVVALVTGFDKTFAFSVLGLLLVPAAFGAYAVAAPFAGFPLPRTRSTPFWRGAPVSSKTTIAPEAPKVLPAPQAHVPEGKAATAAVQRAFTHLTAADLRGLAATPKLTQVQLGALLADHYGLWFRAEGNVEDVDEVGVPGGIVHYVTVRISQDGSPIYAHFQEGADFDAARRLTVGAPVRILGKVWSVTDTSLSIDNCELEGD